MKDYYKILEVHPSASPDIIAKVYKILAKKYHPDTNPQNKEQSEIKLKEINEAYDILSNKEKKEQYDEDYNKETNSVNIQEYTKLQNYCKQLEKNLINICPQYSNRINNPNSKESASYFKAHTIAMKAYNQTFYQALKKFKNKNTCKRDSHYYKRNILALIITLIIIFLLFNIPFVRNFIYSLFTIEQ